MKIKYQSILGGIFDTKEAAIADEKRLPRIIEVYENDLKKFKVGGTFGTDKNLTKEKAEELTINWRRAIAKYKEQWEEAQKSWDKN